MTVQANGSGVSPEARGRGHLISWATGTPNPNLTPGAPTVLLEDAGHLDAVLESGLASPDSVIFVPHAEPGSDPRIVGYDGPACIAGTEMSVGDSYLQIQDYAAGAFMALLGPTVIIVTGPADFQLLLTDADRARAEGRFPEFLTAGKVRLASPAALGAGPRIDEPVLRLYINEQAEISTTTTGGTLGMLGATITDLQQAWSERNEASAQPCAVCLGGVLSENIRVAALTARPWLRSYFSAIVGLRTLGVNGVTGLRASGFGGRLLPSLDDITVSSIQIEVCRDRPLLLWNDSHSYVYAPESGRTFELSRRAAECADALLACGSVDIAASFAPRSQLLAVASFFGGAGISLTAADGVEARGATA